MPGQELLPAVLALVGMDAGPIGKTSFVLRKRVERFHLGNGCSKAAQFLGRQKRDVFSSLQAAGVFGQLIGGAGEREMRRLSGGEREAQGGVLFSLAVAILIRGRTTVGDPLCDEGDVRLGYSRAAPGKRWKLRAVEWELATQAAHQSSVRGPRGRGRLRRGGCAGMAARIRIGRARRSAIGPHHRDAVELEVAQLGKRKIPETGVVQVIRGRGAGSGVHDGAETLMAGWRRCERRLGIRHDVLSTCTKLKVAFALVRSERTSGSVAERSFMTTA
jgi:hypothetical protein